MYARRVPNAAEIRRRLKSGAIHRDGVTLASFLGDPAARSASPEIAELRGGLAELLERLSTLPFRHQIYRRLATVRAMLALVRPILPMARARREDDHATCFHATETWSVCPCEPCAAALRELSRRIQPAEPLELQMQYLVAAVALDPGLAGEVMQKAGTLVDLHAMRDRVADELVAWALRENDPVRASIGLRVFHRLDARESDHGVRRLAGAQLEPAVAERFAALAGSLEPPAFAVPPELPVTAGDRCDLLANDSGLLFASDRLKDALARRVPALEFVPMRVRGSKKERVWLTYSRSPLPALGGGSDAEPLLLDPRLIAGAPILFRLEDDHRDRYLMDTDAIRELTDAGIHLGVHAHAAPFGCSL